MDAESIANRGDISHLHNPVAARPTWGSALGLLNGDPGLLIVRGCSPEQIAAMHEEVRFRKAAGTIVSYAGTEGPEDIPDQLRVPDQHWQQMMP